MSDLISRQAAIDDIWTVSPLARLDRKWVDRWLRQLPPAQPEQRTGKWIEYEQEFMTDRPFETIKKHIRECSLCRTKIAGFNGTMRYCPNCGAKMEGEQDG